MMVALCEAIGWNAEVTFLVLCGAVGGAFWGKDLRVRVLAFFFDVMEVLGFAGWGM